jgi:hypothetical protein
MHFKRTNIGIGKSLSRRLGVFVGQRRWKTGVSRHYHFTKRNLWACQRAEFGKMWRIEPVKFGQFR